MAKDFAKSGLQTYFLSLEMSEEALVERLMCNCCQISNAELQCNPTKYHKQAQDFFTFTKDLPAIITFNVGATKEELEQMIIDLPKPDVVIVDYIQAIRKLQSDRMAAMNEYILSFRKQAVEKNFAAVLVSQINREAMEGDGKEPKLWQLKGSGTIEEHADLVLLTHWESFYEDKSVEDKKKGKVKETNDDVFKVIVAKNRTGKTGTYKCSYLPHFYRLEEKSEYLEDKDKDKKSELIAEAEKDTKVQGVMNTFGGKIVEVEEAKEAAQEVHGEETIGSLV